MTAGAGAFGVSFGVACFVASHVWFCSVCFIETAFEWMVIGDVICDVMEEVGRAGRRWREERRREAGGSDGSDPHSAIKIQDPVSMVCEAEADPN